MSKPPGFASHVTQTTRMASPSVVPSRPGLVSGRLLSPPREWPAAFSSNPNLKALMGRRALRGKRCRLTALPAPQDVAAASSLSLSDDSFANASEVHARLGWTLVRGYAIFELEGEDAFVGHKRWWNEKPSGVWVDLTPRGEGQERMVLLESELSTRPNPQDAISSNSTPSTLPSTPSNPVPAPAPAPPPPPPSPPVKLEFKGNESIERCVLLLRQGSEIAISRAAASLCAFAAGGGEGSQRVARSGAIPALLPLLRAEGEAREQAARAIMSESTPALAPATNSQQLDRGWGGECYLFCGGGCVVWRVA